MVSSKEAELRGLRLFTMHGKGLAAIDWNAIRAEYIAGGIGQRALAAKYGVSYSTLRRRSEHEGWADARKEAGRIASAKAAQKIANTVADNASKLEKARGLLIDKMLQMIQNTPVVLGTSQSFRKDGKTVTFDFKAAVDALERLAASTGGSDESLAKLDTLIKAIDDAAKQ